MRWVYISAGLLALGASCTMAVLASGGLSSQSAPGLVAMAVVLGVGAASIGHALAGRHFGIALVIGLGMLAGEVGAMLQTAQRVSAAREAMRAPLAARALERQTAIDLLAKAEASKPEPVDPTRLEAAERAKIEADDSVREKSAEVGCRENCRLLLQGASESAAREVEAARSEIAEHDLKQAEAIAKRIETARNAVAELPAPQSATPLADNTGMPEWLLDVIEALALSLAINLPSSALVALGVKMGSHGIKSSLPQINMVASEQGAELPVQVEYKPRNALAEAERFGIAMLRPSNGARLLPADLRAAYLGWCAVADLEPLPISEIAPALGSLFRRSGIEVSDGVAIGVAVKSPQIEDRPQALRVA